MLWFWTPPPVRVTPAAGSVAQNSFVTHKRVANTVGLE